MIPQQLPPAQSASRDQVLSTVHAIIRMHREGKLGGIQMPEDANPQLLPDSDDNQHYFTLPMALNYQRSSYTLWESARATYLDEMTRWVFRPRDVLNKDSSELRQALQKHK